jgi:hypothetical protein
LDWHEQRAAGLAPFVAKLELFQIELKVARLNGGAMSATQQAFGLSLQAL